MMQVYLRECFLLCFYCATAPTASEAAKQLCEMSALRDAGSASRKVMNSRVRGSAKHGADGRRKEERGSMMQVYLRECFVICREEKTCNIRNFVII